MILYDFQTEVVNACYDRWREPDIFNLLMNMPTGGGKTVTFCKMVHDFDTPACIMAHRQELVSQASLALNREGIQHDIIAPKAVKLAIVRVHHDIHGGSHYRNGSPVRVAGVDTLTNYDGDDRWMSQVGLVVPDEGHHVLRENKWGKQVLRFPNARGLFPTAHSLRADGRGLGRNADGLADAIVVGTAARTLIDRGFLTDYRLFCPSSDIDFSDVSISDTGEYSSPKLRAATHASSQIVGDIVKEYLKHAAGKLGITFAVDVDGKNGAKAIAQAYRAAGVPAEVITSKTPILIRSQLMQQFRSRLLLQLVSVDCLGEGVDVPAIEVVSMARKTASFQLFAQQFGRALRVMVSGDHQTAWSRYTDSQRRQAVASSTKPKAIIIDHVGNTIFHGLPDVLRTYLLGRAETRTRAQTGVEALRSCPDCTRPYECYLSACPYCGYAPPPRARSTPDQVEGDIIELLPDVLAQLRGDIAKTDGPSSAIGTDLIGNSIRKNHHDRQAAQLTLRKAMELWGGWRLHVGESIRDANRRFWYAFGVDVLSAQTLGVRDAGGLEERIRAELTKHNVEIAHDDCKTGTW